MSPEEFKARAQKIYDSYGDWPYEEGHVERDYLMRECLESLGYKEGIDILFSMQHIWYS